MTVPGDQSHTTSISGNPSGVYVPAVSQGLPTLIVMIVVLVIIVLFCFWGAPAVRAFCKRKICCCCPMDEPSNDNVSTADGSATPTVILLPYGRMLVVDRAVFAQLQADHNGIDFMELSANLIRAQRLHAAASNPSILESEATSKGLSPTSLDFLPPAYEDIFGGKTADLPPSYSEISIMFRNMSGNASGGGAEVVTDCVNNIRDVNVAPLRTSSSVPYVFDEEESFHPGSRLRRFKFASLDNYIVKNDGCITENNNNNNNDFGNAQESGSNIESESENENVNGGVNEKIDTEQCSGEVKEYIDKESSV